jgi:signal transduction histidine kinase
LRCSALRSATDATTPRIGDNGPVSEEAAGQGPRAWLGSVLAFVRWETPREPVPRPAIRADMVLAGVTLILALYVAGRTYGGLGGGQDAAALFASVPLAARRRFPLAAFLVLLVGVLAAKNYVTDLSFLTMIVAAYSAMVHSRFRGLALLCVALAGAVVAYVFWTGGHPGATYAVPRRFLGPGFVPVVPGPGGVYVPQAARWRLDGLVALVALVGLAIAGAAGLARERIRRLQAEHAAATERALEAERARIASELHDVVTHNVSVMIVQAGAARQVLDAAPQEARAALLAVESSGRAAMAELRHLLGLLSPGQPGAETADMSAAGGQAEPELRPQPGLSQLPALVSRMTAAGLPVELHVGKPPPDLPPGLDLAAFRVVQEALTNVLKHAGKPATSVGVDYRDGSLLLEVTDSGRLIPAVGPVAVAGSGRGLLGLRERVGVYGGEVDAGPRPDGGWQVRARIPVEATVPAAVDSPGLAPAAGR